MHGGDSRIRRAASSGPAVLSQTPKAMNESFGVTLVFENAQECWNVSCIFGTRAGLCSEMRSRDRIIQGLLARIRIFMSNAASWRASIRVRRTHFPLDVDSSGNVTWDSPHALSFRRQWELGGWGSSFKPSKGRTSLALMFPVFLLQHQCLIQGSSSPEPPMYPWDVVLCSRQPLVRKSGTKWSPYTLTATDRSATDGLDGEQPRSSTAQVRSPRKYWDSCSAMKIYLW